MSATAADAAEAQTPRQAKPAPKNVVTKAEFKRAKKGMAIKKVHKIFGTKGKQTYFTDSIPEVDIPASQMREYRTPSKYGSVMVTYDKVDGGWKLVSKTAFWGF